MQGTQLDSDTYRLHGMNVTNTSVTSNDAAAREDLDVAFLLYYYGIFLVITCVNIPGNVAVICTVVRNPRLRQPCNFYIASLAVSDLMIALMYPIYVISHLQDNPVGRDLGLWSTCRIVMGQVLALEACSSYTLVAITVTRYIAIVHPLRYHLYVTRRGTFVTIAAIWFFSQCVCAVLYTLYNPKHYAGVCRFELVYSVTHVVMFLAIMLIVPFCVMLTLYTRILNIAKQQVSKMAVLVVRDGASPDTGGAPSVLRSELRSTIMVSILLGLFTLSWTPMCVYFFVSVLCTSCKINKYVRATVRIILYLNSAVNVFIYAGRLSDFRQHIRKDARDCCSLCTHVIRRLQRCLLGRTRLDSDDSPMTNYRQDSNLLLERMTSSVKSSKTTNTPAGERVDASVPDVTGAS